MNHFDSKPQARAHFKSILRSIEPAARRILSHRAAELLAGTPEFERAQMVMIFLSMPEEIDTSPVALLAWARGKIIVAPHVEWSARKLTPIKLGSLSDFASSAQPWKDLRIEGKPIPPSEIDLVLVPALAYSSTGHRLGHGLGFYDRFLTAPGLRATSCGFGFDCQLGQLPPVEVHDVPLNMLVTDARVLRFA